MVRWLIHLKIFQLEKLLSKNSYITDYVRVLKGNPDGIDSIDGGLIRVAATGGANGHRYSYRGGRLGMVRVPGVLWLAGKTRLCGRNSTAPDIGVAVRA